MKKIFPNLKQHYIDDMFFRGLLEGPIEEIRKYWTGKGLSEHIDKDEIIFFETYRLGKALHLVILRIELLEKNKAVLHVDLTSKSNISIRFRKSRDFSEKYFIEFFQWLLKTSKIKTSRMAMLAHCRLPLNDELQYPPPIPMSEEGPVYTTGVKFGFDEKMGVETVVVEKIKNKETPLYFMVETLPFFKFDAELFNEKFFDAPIALIKKLISIFCKKKIENKEQQHGKG